MPGRTVQAHRPTSMIRISPIFVGQSLFALTPAFDVKYGRTFVADHWDDPGGNLSLLECAINFDSAEFLRLLNQARDGDEPSIGILLQKYKSYLLLIANNDVDPSVKPKFGASDIVQETMLSAHQNFAQFAGDSEAEWKGWLRTILKNDIHQATRSLKGTKKRALDREVPLSLRSSLQIQLVDRHDTPGTEALIREDAKRLESAMALLSDEHREVIELRSWQELPFEDVGMKMERSANAARKLWNRAIVQLQRELEKTVEDR